MMKLSYLIPGLLLCAASISAQNKQWTLKECIDYAIDNNIDVQQRELETQNQEIEVNTAQMSRLPNLNANLGQQFGFGRSQDRDNVMVDNSSSMSSFNVQTSVPVFTGFRIPNQIKAKKLDLAASIEDLKKAKEDISLNITSYYLQVLFYKELLYIAQQQLELTQVQLDQTTKLVENGKTAISEVYQVQAQLAKDELTRTESGNNVMLALLDLSQLLNLTDEAGFDIESPDITQLFLSDMEQLVTPQSAYEYSLENRPAIQAAKFRLESSYKSLNIAKSQYYPSLNFSAGYSNNYYYNYNLPEGVTNASFKNQLKNNGSESLGLTLSIPIFNRFSVRNQVRQSKLSIESQKLQLLNAKQTLYKEIQQAYYNAYASKDKFKSAEKAVEAARISFEFEETKYTNGRSTFLDYTNARTLLERSRAEEAQAKYEYIFRTKILDFYNGRPLYVD